MHLRQLAPLRARRPAAASHALAARRPAASTAVVQRHTAWHTRQHIHAPSALFATGDGTDDKRYAADEMSEYEELLRQKKAAKQQALESAIRKRKQKAAAAQQQQQQQQTPPADTDPSAASATPDSITSFSSGATAAAAAAGKGVPAVPTGARFSARPRSIPSALRQAQQQRQQLPPQHQQHLSDSPTSTAPPSPAAGADVAAVDADVAEITTEGLPSDDVLQAMLNELLEGEPSDDDDEGNNSTHQTDISHDNAITQQQQSAAPRVQRRKTPSEIRVAAIARRAAQRKAIQQQLQRQDAVASSSSSSSSKVHELVSVPKYNDSKLSKLAASDPQAAALQQMLAAAAAEEDDQSSIDESGDQEGGDSDTHSDLVDDLDWDALGQYEQLEQYLGDLQRQQNLPAWSAAAAAAVPPAALTASASSSSSSGKAQIPPPAAAPRKLKRVPAGTAARQFEKDLDELEQFVSLFEAMEAAKAGNSSLQRPQQQQQQQADAGEALVAALLGKDWEAELLDDLAAVIDDEDDVTSDQAAASNSSSTGQQQQDGSDLAAAEDDQPWADEVTNLLLGLVTASHDRYLKPPLPLPDLETVTEDNRCSAFWSAPWALFVTDDSGQYNMEYVNESACQMLGGSYLDLFGQAAFELVDSSLEAQSDWAYAVQRVEGSGVNCARMPQLAMKDMSGQPVVAKDVCMWRVDSLEDTPIGMAVLVKSWQK